MSLKSVLRRPILLTELCSVCEWRDIRNLFYISKESHKLWKYDRFWKRYVKENFQLGDFSTYSFEIFKKVQSTHPQHLMALQLMTSDTYIEESENRIIFNYQNCHIYPRYFLWLFCEMASNKDIHCIEFNGNYNWMQFLDFTDLSKIGLLRSMSIVGIGMDKRAGQQVEYTQLANYLRKNTKLKYLTIANANLSDKTLVELSNALLANSNIESFNIRDSAKCSFEALKTFCLRLKDQPSLDFIYLPDTLTYEQKVELYKEIEYVSTIFVKKFFFG